MRPATRWIRVVSRASARVIAGRMVVSRRASIDFPAPGGPRRRTLWAERLHPLRVRLDLWGELRACERWFAATHVIPQRPGSPEHLGRLEGGVGETLRPRARTVFRLMTGSNFMGCSTTKSVGLPLTDEVDIVSGALVQVALARPLGHQLPPTAASKRSPLAGTSASSPLFGARFARCRVWQGRVLYRTDRDRSRGDDEVHLA